MEDVLLELLEPAEGALDEVAHAVVLVVDALGLLQALDDGREDAGDLIQGQGDGGGWVSEDAGGLVQGQGGGE